MWCGGVQFVVMSDTSVRVAVRFVHCTLHMYLISLSSAHFKAGMPYSITHSVGIVFVGYTLTQLVWYDIYDYFPSQTAYLHHVRIVHNAEHCNSQSASVRPSVRPSVRHVPVLCADEWRFDPVVFSIWQDNPPSLWKGIIYPDIRRRSPSARALKCTTMSLAKIWPVIGRILKTVQDRR